MWNTIKRIKKLILLKIDNIKNKDIYLPELTFGLQWEQNNSIIGNARLTTYDNINSIVLKSQNLNKNSINVSCYNTKYKKSVTSMLLLERAYHFNKEISTKGFEVNTKHNTLTFYGMFAYNSNGLVEGSGVYISFTVDIYGILENGEEVFLDYFDIDGNSWATTSEFDVWESNNYREEYTIGTLSFLKTVSLETSSYSFEKLKVYANNFVFTDVSFTSTTSMYLNVYYTDTTQELERTSTDIHLIAWEES